MRVLCFTAINPERRFADAEKTIAEIKGVTTWLPDARGNAGRKWYDVVLEKYRDARRMTLDYGYDALLTAESDMLIPRDALQKMWALDAPVVYAPYVLRHGATVWNMCAVLEEDAGFFLTDPIVRGNAPHEWRALNAGLPFRIYGAGFGCTLIRRAVLEQLDFRNFEDDGFYVDWAFAADCNARGIVQMCEPRVLCGHIADTKILYPDLTQTDLCRVENYAA